MSGTDLIALGSPLAVVPGLMLSVVFLVLWDANRTATHCLAWSGGFLLDALSMAVAPVAGYGAHDPAAHAVVSSVLSLAGLGLVAAGVVQFTGRRFGPVRIAITLGGIALLTAVVTVDPPAARVLFDLITLGVYGVFAWRLGSRSRTERVAGGLFLARGLNLLGLTRVVDGYGFLLWVQVCQLLALAAGIALLCASFQRANTDVRSANRLFALVEEAFSRLSGVTDRAGVYTRLAALLHGGTGVPMVALYELDRPHDLLRLQACEGGADPPGEIAGVALRQVLQTRHAQVLAGADVGLPGPGALVCFPLVYGARVSGAGLLAMHGARAAVAQELAALEAVGRAAGFALAGVEQRDRLHHAAGHDLVTGLANRSCLHDEYELRRDQGGLERGAVVLLIGLSALRDVNRAHGHYAGDRLLERTARRLETLCAGHEALAVRLGGAEFALVFYRHDDAGVAAALAARVHEVFAQDFDIDGVSIAVRASVGIAIAADNGPDDREMIRRAEIAMSSARAGGVPTVLYEPAQDAARRQGT